MSGKTTSSTSEESKQDATGDLDYGYDFYPERRGEQDTGFWQRLTASRSAGRRLKCYANVQWCIKNSE